MNTFQLRLLAACGDARMMKSDAVVLAAQVSLSPTAFRQAD